MPVIRNLLVKLGFQGNDALRGLDATDRKITGAKGKADDLGAALKKAGAALGVFAVARAGLQAVDKSLEFGKALGLLQTFLGGNVERATELRDAIVAMSQDTGKPLEDLTRGVAEVVSAFGDSEATIGRTKIAVDAARAGFATTLDAVALLSAVTKNYGDTSEEALLHVSDLSFQVVKDGQTTFPELAAAMGKIAPIAKASGVSVEELFAVFATGTGVLGTASELATQTKGAITQLLNPTAAGKKALKELAKEGIKSGSDLIAKRGFGGALRALVATTDGSTESINKLFSNVEAQGLVLSFTGAQAATFDGKLANMGRTTGNTAQAVKAATGGFNAQGHAMEVAEAKATALQVQIGDKLAPVLAKLKVQAAEVADSVATDLGLAFGDVGNDAEKAIPPFRDFANVLGFVLKGLGVTIGSVSDLLQLGISGIAAGAAALTTDDKGRAAIAAQFRRDHRPRALGLVQRVKDVGQSVLDPEALAARRELQIAGADARGAIAQTNVDQRLEVRIDQLIASVPEGATVEQARAAMRDDLTAVLRRTRREMARDIARGNPAAGPAQE